MLSLKKNVSSFKTGNFKFSELKNKNVVSK